MRGRGRRGRGQKSMESRGRCKREEMVIEREGRESRVYR